MVQSSTQKTETLNFTHINGAGLPDFTGSVSISVGFDYGEDQWVGHCHELGTVACADSEDEVKFELREFIALQLDGMEQIADIHKYLVQNEVAIVTIQSNFDRVVSGSKGFVIG